MSKNPDSLLALEPHERMLCRAGLPAYMWNPKSANIIFKPTKSRGSKKSTIAQQHWFKTLMTQPTRRTQLIVIASGPTDVGAMYTAVYCILRLWTLHNHGGAILNVAGNNEMVKNRSYDKQPKNAILYGLHANSSNDRKEALRDLITNLYLSLRIVVVGGCAEPERWMTHSVGVYPDAAFFVRDIHPANIKDK